MLPQPNILATMNRFRLSWPMAIGWIVGLILFITQEGPGRVAIAEPIATPEQPQAIMPLDQVRIGMKGYGLTVFQGTKIEPFPVEVISVIHDQYQLSGPKRAVIWVRCDEPRLIKSGPVAGMSGSPIYLWPEGPAAEPGEGGLLVGAFAFGFSWTRDCFAGVQPIELMRQVGQNALKDRDAAAPLQGRRLGRQDVLEAMDQLKLPPHTAWRSRLLGQLGPELERPKPLRKEVAGPGLAGENLLSARRMLVPLTMPSRRVARAFGPMLEELGLMAVAGSLGRGPVEYDPQTIVMEPGSMLSIPLGFGDLEFGAAGTVTEVLPDGRVLAFGHSMFGDGPAALPMASGYVHFIVSNQISSFKLSGSAVMRGAIVRDELSAIVGVPDRKIHTAPIEVKLTLPGEEQRVFEYQVVDHRIFTPVVAAVFVMQSVESSQNLPPENTARMRGHMRFSGNRELTLDTLMPGASGQIMAFEIMPLIASMIDNTFERGRLESMSVTIDVDNRMRSATVVAARLDRDEAAPGETIGILVDLLPYKAAKRTERIELELPRTLESGSYQLIVGDSRIYASQLFGNRPHLLQVGDLDELAGITQRVLDIPDNALHAMMFLLRPGIAIGRDELPKLPSSRQALITGRKTTSVRSYREWIHKQSTLDLVPHGEAKFMLTVRELP